MSASCYFQKWPLDKAGRASPCCSIWEFKFDFICVAPFDTKGRFKGFYIQTKHIKTSCEKTDNLNEKKNKMTE